MGLATWQAAAASPQDSQGLHPITKRTEFCQQPHELGREPQVPDKNRAWGVGWRAGRIEGVRS